MIALPGTINQANIKFYGDRNDYPKAFRQNFKAYFKNMKSQLSEYRSDLYALEHERYLILIMHNFRDNDNNLTVIS